MHINITLFGQMITFLVFVWFTMKFVWPPVIKALHERQAKIADGLAAAEQGKQELKTAQNQFAQTLREARDQATRIVTEANQRKERILEEATHAVRAERERLLAATHQEISLQYARAKETLRGQVVAIAMAGTERLLGAVIDQKTHQQVLQRFIAEL